MEKKAEVEKNQIADQTTENNSEAATPPQAEEKSEKRFKILGVELVYLYFFGIGVAFLGWFAENVMKLITHGVLDSKYHILPFISPYALIVLAFHIALGDPDDLVLFGKKIFKQRSKRSVILSNLFSFLLICAFVFLGELVVGNLWDILFGVSLWNYSGWPGELTQYTSLPSTFGFGLGAYLIFKLIYKPLLNLIRTKVSFKFAKIVTLTLGMLIILDTTFMIVHLAIFNEAPQYWSIRVYDGSLLDTIKAWFN